jgi:anti-sigma factor RsiW
VIRWITCREFVEFLDDYLAQRLPPEQVAEFNNHLSGCPPCVTYLRTYRDSVTLARAALAASAEPLPDTVPEPLVAAILASRRKDRS